MVPVEGYAARARERMVEQLRGRGVGDRTLAAFARVPRHLLVPAFWVGTGGPPHGDDPAALDLLHDADRAVAVNQVADAPGMATSTASAPSLLAAQADRLDLAEGMCVLEIGTGPGYFAAILAELVGPSGRVVTVEIDRPLAEATAERLAASGYGRSRVTVVTGDGDLGAPGEGPFDRVVASVGCADVAPAWLDQLGDGGWALVPVQHGGTHPTMEVRRDGTATVAMRSGYVAIQGRQAETALWPNVHAHVELTEATPLPDRVRRAVATEPGRERLFGLRAWDLTFWVAVADQRAGFMISLHDGDGSSARVDAGAGRLEWGGPAGEALAADLLGHADDWLAAGQPTIDSFRHRFVAGGTAAADWTIHRIHHDQLISR